MKQINNLVSGGTNSSPADGVFRSISENTSAAVLIYQKNKIRYMNRAFTDMVGYEAVELLGKDFWEIVDPDFTELERKLGLARQEGKEVPSHYEIKLRKKSGEERWGDFTFSVINYRDELAILATAYDITDLKIGKQKIAESERSYRILVDQSSVPIMVQSDGLAIYMNTAALKLLGAESLDTVIGKPITDFVHSESMGAITTMFSVQEKYSQRAELSDQRFLRSDGSEIVVDLLSAPIFFLGKSAYQIQLRDVTKEKQRREVSHLQSVALNNITSAVVVTDKDAKVIWANRAIEELTGYSPEEFVGKKMGELVRSGKQDKEFYRNLWDITLAGKTWQGEIVNRRKDGSIYREDMTIVPVMDESGTATHFIAIKQVHEERVPVQGQKPTDGKLESNPELAGVLVHDYNNILATILGYGEILRKKFGQDKDVLHSLDVILSSTVKGAGLTKHLESFAQSGTGAPEVLDVNSSINSTIRMLQSTKAIDGNVMVDLKQGMNLWKVKMDPSHLNRIVSDLVEKARRSIEKEGTITIRTSNIEVDEAFVQSQIGFKAGKYVQITFSDTGRGMDQESMERVFEPHMSTRVGERTEEFRLSSVYEIVKQYDGNVNVSSKLGAGTTFNIFLPRFFEDDLAIVESLSGDRLNGKETILVVEDEPDMLWLIKQNLEYLGYNVLTANNPNDALNLNKTYNAPIDLLLTDIIMPVMNGKQLSDEIIKTRREIKILFMSGYTAGALDPQVYFKNGLHLLQKPFTFDELAKRVRYLLKPGPELNQSNFTLSSDENKIVPKII